MMRNIMQILRRDIRRLLKVPAALAVVIALIIMPSAYSWYNVVGFWSPYENTSNLRICVVSEDTGATHELTGPLNAGQAIIDAMSEDNQMDWIVTTREDAINQVKSGQSYAAFIIPSDFTSNLLSIVTASFTSPKIEYFVNEKLGPVSPKITDTGASILDETVNATFVSKVSEAVLSTMDDSVSQKNATVSQSSSHAEEAVAEAINTIDKAANMLSSLQGSASGVRNDIDSARSDLRSAQARIEGASNMLRQISSDSAQIQDQLQVLSSDVSVVVDNLLDALGSIADSGGPVGEAAREAMRKVEEYAQSYYGTTLPALNNVLTQVSAGASSLSSVVTNLRFVVEQADVSMDQLISTMSAVEAAASQTGSLLGSLANDLGDVRSSILAISSTNAITTIIENTGLSATDFASYISAPTTIATEKLYPVNAYGSGMAPLFMSLTSWVGAFMLMIILRQEVDAEGVEGLTVTQRYFGRFLLLSIIAVLQAVVCCAGVLMLGVKAVSPFALFVASIFSSVTYLGITFALSSTMQHVGKGLCLLLVFLQIPGATGLYPIEMTSSFFQVLYPLMPFTYGIGAMREAICGFYGMQYAQCLGILGLFLAGSTAFGVIVRPLLSNVSRMFADQVQETGILIGEDVEVPAREFRISQLFKALIDQKDYREELLDRFLLISSFRPRIIRWSIIVGIAVTVASCVALAVSTSAKVVLLTIWLVLLFAIFVVLIIAENLRGRLERELRLEDMTDQDIIKLYEQRKNVQQISHSSADVSVADASELDSDASGFGSDSGVAVDAGRSKNERGPAHARKPGHAREKEGGDDA